jgi:ribonuclease E
LNKPAGDLPKRLEKRSESKPQNERSPQRKQARPPRDDRTRGETKLPAEENVPAEEVPPQEEASRRRRRGGRQRERAERPLRENKQLAPKHSHLRQVDGEAVQPEGKIETEISQPLPEFVQEAPALTLVSSEQVAVATGGPGSATVAEPPLMHEDVAAKPEMEQPEPGSTELPEAQPEDLENLELPVQLTVEQTGNAELPRSTSGERETQDNGQSDRKDLEKDLDAAQPLQVEGYDETEQPLPSQIIELPDLRASGLVMVETIPEKLKPGESDAGTEMTRRRRKQHLPVQIPEQDEPLVQVETHK